jgi:hypothetical protein
MALKTNNLAQGPGVAAAAPVRAVGSSGRQMKLFVGTFDLDASYPTGGYDMTGTTGQLYDLLQKEESYLNVPPQNAPGGAGGLTAGHVITFVWDKTNKKLMVFDNNAQVPNATSLALFTGIPFLAYGV